jgi:RimJ/RimL family protein N-acetyltransferase
MTETPVLVTRRLVLRPWREDDLDRYAQIFGDPEVTRYLGDGAPLTRAQSEERIAYLVSHWREHGFGHWAVEDRATESLIGRIGLLHHPDWREDPDNVEVGWTLARAFWGRGLATEGALASLRYGFETLDLDRIISITSPTNRASRRVMEKVGLTLTGQSFWRNERVVWYEIDRSSWARRAPTAVLSSQTGAETGERG